LEQMIPNWYNLEQQEIELKLNTSIKNGLSGGQAAKLQKIFGENKLRISGGKSFMMMIADQFNNVIIFLLIFAAIVSCFIGEISDSIVILVVIILNGLIGFIQEFRAKSAMISLKNLSVSKVRAKRNGKIIELSAEKLLPGDIVYLESGMRIPADGRIIDASNLKINESALTGESVPIDKIPYVLKGENIALADQLNMAYMGTTVSYGRGVIVVVSTGMKTELGKIAEMVEKVEFEKTPLQKKLDKLGRNLVFIVSGIVAIVFVVGLLRGHEIQLMLLTSISLAVAAVPEGLPAVITIALAIGAKYLSKKKAIIRNLPAVETLGSVTTICTDKTGTITENKIKVSEIFGWETKRLLESIMLCNDVSFGGSDPMEEALLVYSSKSGIKKEELDAKFPRIAEVPFSSERKRMTTVHKDPSGKIIAYCKGAFDSLTPICVNIGGFADKNKYYAAAGMRVIGVAYKIFDEMPQLSEENIEKDMTFLGVIAMSDPPRAEAASAISSCYKAGIRPVMITGDHALTAAAVAKKINMIGPEKIITGAELDKLAESNISDEICKYNIFARVSPKHKLTIVNALKAKGEIVAMTGDGINDAPALKQADIGVSMGITGTDVSKEASDMILLDDNFATLVSAVEQGRVIYDNMRKFIRYVLSTNLGEILTMFIAILVGLPLPILPIQILWINLVTDGAPAIGLGFEPADDAIMKRPPRPPDENILGRGVGIHITWVSVLIAGGTLLNLILGIKNGHGVTMAFMTLVFFQLFHVMAIRSERFSSLTKNIFSNMFLLVSVGIIIVLQFAITFIPQLQKIFHTSSLNIFEVILCILVSSTVFFFVEVEKYIIRKNKFFL